MSDERLTDEEVERVADLIKAIVPVALILTESITDENAELLDRAVTEADGDRRHMEAASVAYMAMGVDIANHEEIQRARRMMPVLKSVLELRAEVKRAQEDEEKFNERQAARSSFRRLFESAM